MRKALFVFLISSVLAINGFGASDKGCSHNHLVLYNRQWMYRDGKTCQHHNFCSVVTDYYFCTYICQDCSSYVYSNQQESFHTNPY